jgi:hypothetical protein
MDNAPKLVLGDKTYYIGKRGGLYHQYNVEGAAITRIHSSHLPAHHQAPVTKFQEDYVKAHGRVVLHRQGTQIKQKVETDHTKTNADPEPQKNLEQNLANITSNSTNITSNSKTNSTSNKSQKSHSKPQKISRKSKPNIHDPIVLIAAEARQAQHVALPSTWIDAQRNIETLCKANRHFVPEWVSRRISAFLPPEKTFFTKIYYASGMQPAFAKRLAVERTLLQKENENEIVKKNFFDLSVQKDVIGIYVRATVSFDDGKTLHDLHTYVAYEPHVYHASLTLDKIYIQMLDRALICAVTVEAKEICFDIDSMLRPWSEARRAFEHIRNSLKTQGISIALSLITQDKDIVWDKKYSTLQLAVQDTPSDDHALFVSFYDMRFVFNPKSVFHNCSSMAMQTCGLTNLDLTNDANYVVC